MQRCKGHLRFSRISIVFFVLTLPALQGSSADAQVLSFLKWLKSSGKLIDEASQTARLAAAAEASNRVLEEAQKVADSGAEFTTFVRSHELTPYWSKLRNERLELTRLGVTLEDLRAIAQGSLPNKVRAAHLLVATPRNANEFAKVL